VYESIYADAFIANLLRSDTTLTGADALNGSPIYKGVAPQNAPFPRVVFNLQAGTDNTGVNKTRLFPSLVYQVRTVGIKRNEVLQDAARVRKSANRVDALMNVRRVSYTVDSQAFFFNVWREGEIPSRDEPGETADVGYRNYGGMYRVEVFT
jgi:hypothetical protein